MATIYPDTTGTTSPIFVPRSPGLGVIAPGKCYFTIKIAAAQAAYFGPIWDQPNKLIVTSQVVIDHPTLGSELLRAIQRSRQIRRNGVEHLGLSPNLIKLVPATMKSVSISIEFIVDVKNKLDGLATLINSDAFLAAASFAPGGAVVAKTVGGIAQQLIQTFFTAEEQKPILQFSGDFNISTKELRDGYYVVLGTRDPANSFPRPMPQLAIENNELMVGGGVATRWSYVIFDVRSVDVRGRDSSGGAPWDEKLRRAEAEAQNIAHDFSANSADRRSAWERCMVLIKRDLLPIGATKGIDREGQKRHERFEFNAARGYRINALGKEVGNTAK